MACRCAKKYLEVFAGHLGHPFPAGLRGRFDVVVAVVPYVPSDMFAYLPRDVRTTSPVSPLTAARVALECSNRPSGPPPASFIGAGRYCWRSEASSKQPSVVLSAAGFGPATRHYDDEGDLRGVEAAWL